MLCTVSEPEFSPLLKEISEHEGANRLQRFSAGWSCPPEDRGLCLGTSVVVMTGVGVERMLLFTHSAHDSPTENDPHPQIQISTVSTGEKLCKRRLGVTETGKHCVQNHQVSLMIAIYSTSIYPPAVGQTFTEWASFTFLTAKGCEDNESRTVLLCTYCVPGTSHASSTRGSISQSTPATDASITP